MQRRSRDLVTTKKDLRRNLRCGADNKLPQGLCCLLQNSDFSAIRLYGVRVRVRVSKLGKMLLIARLRGGSRQIALLFFSKKEKVSCKKSILNYTSK